MQTAVPNLEGARRSTGVLRSDVEGLHSTAQRRRWILKRVEDGEQLSYRPGSYVERTPPCLRDGGGERGKNNIATNNLCFLKEASESQSL